jgi:tyrosine-protein kinase
VHEQPRAPLAEAFRQLRTNLEYVDLDQAHKLTMVTSALPHEGKTTTACNLAIALAQSGKKVILIEADLRRPKAASYLGMENAVGLTTVLTGQVALELAIQPWRGGLMDFLGSGALPPNPSELLASSKTAAVLTSLSARYDAVILDAAPTLPVADAAVLAAHCHAVLLVARHGWVRAEQIVAAAETIRRVGAPVLGVVLSMVPRSKHGSYSYQHAYGYGFTQTNRGSRGASAAVVAPTVSSDLTSDSAALLTSTAFPTSWSSSGSTPNFGSAAGSSWASVPAVPTPRSGGLGAPPPPITPAR